MPAIVRKQREDKTMVETQTPANTGDNPSALDEALANAPAQTDAPDKEQGPPPGPIRRYLRDSRNLLNSLLMVLPLFVIYQIGVLTTGGVQNGVDFVTSFLRFTVFGGHTGYYVLFNCVILVAMLGTAWALRHKEKFNPKVFGGVLLESTLYGMLLGGLIGGVLIKLGIEPSLAAGQAMGPWDNFILSLGAGLYEELVFRLILLGGSVWALTKVAKLKTLPTVIGAVLVTSFIFSSIHYVGSMADDFTLYSFSFRFLAGILFAGLFYVRGFAVAVYTHAIYDVIVTVF